MADQTIHPSPSPRKDTKLNVKLDKISESLLSLSETVLKVQKANTKLQQSNEEFRDDFIKLRGEINEVKEEIQNREKEWTSNLDSARADINSIRDQSARDVAAIRILNEKNEALEETIDRLESRLEAQRKELIEIRDTIEYNSNISDHKLDKLMQEITSIRIQSNDLEAHGRRWAVRIMGYRAPAIKPETTIQCKEIVIDFLRDKLKLGNIHTQDIDCAHRIGGVTKTGNQTILAKFFRRDHTDQILRVKKSLKGSGVVVFEDTTFLNRRLLKQLKDHPDFESSWCQGGTVWAKPVNGSKKMKVSIVDDIDNLVQEVPIPTLASSPIQEGPQVEAAATEEAEAPEQLLDATILTIAVYVGKVINIKKQGMRTFNY
jgi:hypothetical protein